MSSADAFALARADAFSPTPVARYLAVAGAHVTVTAHYRPIEADDFYAVHCEACGLLSEGDDHDSELIAAQGHAETCRRIPERLWAGGDGR